MLDDDFFRVTKLPPKLRHVGVTREEIDGTYMQTVTQGRPEAT